jgi:ribosomal protection tetracycline resistance protein
MQMLNLGILAHVDAGKTSLTERLLHTAGVIDEIGSVDDGTTQTDTLALERQRGITIKSAVVSFAIDDVVVNLIDTPGHPDFIAEVERVLHVLDGAVLVVSAVEGVQAQTRTLMRTLRRLGIPTLVFVNKIDRAGARSEPVLRAIAEKLTPAIVPMGSTTDLGTRTAAFTPYTAANASFTSLMAEVLAEHDDTLLAAYLDGDEAAIPYQRVRGALAEQTGQALVHPVFFGSAITGAGVETLTAAITELLPAAEGKADQPASGTVFKVERGPAGEKVAYLRMFSGTLHTRDQLTFGQPGSTARITAISVFDRGSTHRRTSVTAGQIAKVWGLGDVRIGDTIGVPRTMPSERLFAPPTLETVVVPRRPADKAALHTALTQLAEQDPLINLRQDTIRQEISVCLYGEVQKQVIQATLAKDFAVETTFRETTTICIERPAGTGTAVEFMNQAGNPFRAAVGLRIEPGTVGSGGRFRLEIELGSLPFAFVKAVEETVHQTLQQGLHGWQVTDYTVTMTHSDYTPPPPHGWSKWSSSAGDFRNLTPLVLMQALQQAGTTVYEPMHRFRLEIPTHFLGTVLPALSRLHAVPQAPTPHGSSYLLEGHIPAAHVHALGQQLPALASGEADLECAFDHYQPVPGRPPIRSRTDHNPLNRKEYLLHIARRVQHQ